MKKTIPINLRKILDEEFKNAENLFDLVRDDGGTVLFTDLDDDSDYFFEIVDIEEKNDPLINIKYYPSSANNILSKSASVKIHEFKAHFVAWKNLLIQANSKSELFDDPIVTAHKENYFTEFEIIDEEKKKPLNPHQILLLDSHFEQISKEIDKYVTESNSNQISEIKEDIADLRKNLSGKTRVWIANRVSWIWAKMTKLGPKLIKDFVNEGKKQIVKEGVTQLIEAAKQLIT